MKVGGSNHSQGQNGGLALGCMLKGENGSLANRV